MIENFENGLKDAGEVIDEVKNMGEQQIEDADLQHKVNEDLTNPDEETAYGFSSSKACDTMSSEDRTLLISALRDIKEASVSTSELAREYCDYFYAIFGVETLPDFEADNLSKLSGKNAEYVLYVIIEYKAFFDCETALKKVDELTDCLTVSPKRRREYEEYVKAVADDISLQGILNKYETQALRAKNRKLEDEIAEGRQKVTDAGEKLADLDKMIKDAETAVKVATAAAGGIGAVPIPFADAPLLVANQVALMTSVAVIFKIGIKEDGLKPLASAALGIAGAPIIGKTIVANLFKLIPGIGSVAGGAISATVAMAITYAIGSAFIEICKAVKRGELAEKDINSKTGADMFKNYFTSFAETYARIVKNRQNVFAILKEQKGVDDEAIVTTILSDN